MKELILKRLMDKEQEKAKLYTIDIQDSNNIFVYATSFAEEEYAKEFSELIILNRKVIRDRLKLFGVGYEFSSED